MSEVKNISYSNEARTKIKSGVKKLAKAVSATLGTRGRNVIIEKEYGAPASTKDGVTVANEIFLKDPIENAAAQIVKDVASRTALLAGDGTTTATVLSDAILDHMPSTEHTTNWNPIEIKRGMDKAVQEVVKELQKISIPISDNKQIEQIATISANNDSEIGKIIAKAMEEVGKDGVITIEEGRTADTRLEIVEGIQIDKGYISPYMVTDTNNMQTVLENPNILIYDKKISAVKDILHLLEEVSQKSEPILIIAEDVTDEALAALIVNKARGLLNAIAVKAPGYGDKRLHILEDIAILTGGKVLSETKGLNLATATLADLGHCRSVTITKDKTTIVAGAGDIKVIETRISEIKNQIDKSDSDFEKEVLQDRLGRISGGVAVIHLGAASEIEMKEKKDRVEDALHATKAAVDEGILPGGGIALLATQRILRNKDYTATNSKYDNQAQLTGAKIIIDIISRPYEIILQNAGIAPDVVRFKIDAVSKSDPWTGFDARNEKVVNMLEAGIIDPTKVTRIALENAVSAVGTLMVTEVVITREPKDESKAATN